MKKTNYYIEGLIRHDRKVLQDIYKNFSHRIERHIVKTGGSIEDAKDVFQDAIMVIYRKVKTPDFELSSQFYTYLFGICRFIWDRKRKKKGNNTVTILENNRYTSKDNLEKDMIKQERLSFYQQKFSELGDECKQLLELYYTKMSMTHIAEQLGLSNEHAARSRKYRCLKKLENLMKEDERFAELIH